MRRLLLAALMSILVTACTDAEPAVSSTDPINPEPTVPATSQPTSTVAPATTSTTTSVATTTTSTTTAPSGELAGWDSWTLIYASLPIEEHDHDDAVRIAEGIDGAAVLLSDNYRSLNPGYFVVYAGSWGSRREAGAWCPANLDSELTCYPRYLGHSVPDALAGGAVLAELGGGELVVMEPNSGEISGTFNQYFGGDGAYPGHFAVTADASALFFGMGFEDSWYSCESEQGQVRRLDLDSGTETVWSDGWSPAVSPDGRWLALVAATECYPDPEVAEWFVAPGSQVEIYDLADGDRRPDHVLRPATAPTSYDDPNRVRWVGWDPAADGILNVWLGDGTTRAIGFDSSDPIGDGELVWASEIGELAAVSVSSLYVVEANTDSTHIAVVSRDKGETTEEFTVDGWVTGFALGRGGEVIITTWEYLILPNGERVEIDGGISNLGW